MPPRSQVCPLVNGVLPAEITPFYHKLYIQTKKNRFRLNQPCFHIVMARGKYDMWGCLLSHLKYASCISKMQQNFLRYLSLMASMILGDAFGA